MFEVKLHVFVYDQLYEREFVVLRLEPEERILYVFLNIQQYLPDMLRLLFMN